jgi:hypothetical protein
MGDGAAGAYFISAWRSHGRRQSIATLKRHGSDAAQGPRVRRQCAEGGARRALASDHEGGIGDSPPLSRPAKSAAAG